MQFGSFDDYWQPFLGGASPTSAFAADLNRETDSELERTVRARSMTCSLMAHWSCRRARWRSPVSRTDTPPGLVCRAAF